MDLMRQPPRRPTNLSMGGVVNLARMTDKARAHNSGTLGAYWYGEDSGFDRRILEFLGLTEEAFATALREHGSDAEVETWLGEHLTGKTAQEIASFNDSLVSFAPTSDRQKQFLQGVVAGLDPQRPDIDTYMAMTALDDKVTFARLRALS